MRRVNGFGPAIAGWYREPNLPGFYYKQFVVTALFMPVMLGFIYLVSDAEGGGWRFHARLPFGHFVKRFGWVAYLLFVLTALLESALMLVALLLALAFAYGVVWLLKGVF
ncbi:hypothetical protein [Brevundimonas sp.]|uniref:hypothetical protein n=1 Tax=Brevundimonas sp. TaxID=1871086 RepID=UPI0028A7FAE7|nr:hypothetical protein [Brevundimonas sp.]